MATKTKTATKTETAPSPASELFATLNPSARRFLSVFGKEPSSTKKAVVERSREAGRPVDPNVTSYVGAYNPAIRGKYEGKKPGGYTATSTGASLIGLGILSVNSNPGKGKEILTLSPLGVEVAELARKSFDDK